MILPTDYQNFIHQSRYARWDSEKGRRETWEETVDRYVQNVVEPLENVNPPVVDVIKDRIKDLEVMPSMRMMMTAGAALNRDNTAGYNCAYLAVDNVRAFDEALYILMCGTGVGFSVERQFIDKLPSIPRLERTDNVIVVQDSKEGWGHAVKKLIRSLYSGYIPTWDLSKLRPAGALLKTFGGRASGPEPLDRLLRFIVSTFDNAQGRKLNSLECHDIMCMIGDAVVVGGVRRSAMISLSNLTDGRMRHAKSGNWWDNTLWRQLSNNSVCYTEKPDMEAFLREWTALIESKSGERGIFNRQAAEKQVLKYGRRKGGFQWGCNPCSEILLRPNQFCNLTEVVIRAGDTEQDILDKVEVATILGTIQSTYTHFPYLRKIWKDNTEEERLLGVSLTGILDNEDMISLDFDLGILREHAVQTNKKWAELLGIPASTAITCVKPSGTVSQLVDSASGIHARHSEYYIRTVRGANSDPLTQFMIAQGVPNEPEFGKEDSSTVFSFPMKSPYGALTRNERSAVEQLRYWLVIQDEYCEHKPSITISVREHEWLEVGAYVYDHFDSMSGVSFLPHDDHVYQQAPYQECNKKDYEALLEKMPVIDWSQLSNFEQEDNTVGNQTLACTGNSCDIVDLS